VERGVPGGWKALLVLPGREALRARVAHRVRAMMAAGWGEEVRQIVAEGHEPELRRLRPLGYGEWLEGGDAGSLEARIIRSTQAYAKRQVTFFRNQWPEMPVWDPDGEPLSAALERLGL